MNGSLLQDLASPALHVPARGRISRAALPGLALVLVSCGGDAGPVPFDVPAAEEAARLAAAVPTCSDLGFAGPHPAVEVLAEGLEVPWGIAEAPDGRILVSERPGRIRVVRDGVLAPEPWAEVEVYAASEAGLMGLALAPDFETSGEVFVAATVLRYPISGLGRVVGAALRRFERLLGRSGAVAELQVIRFRDEGGRGVDPRVVVEGIPAYQLHAGAALAFAPDGTLYLTMGDAAEPGTAADPSDPRGSILRFRRDGSVPGDNPRPGSPVLAHGFRDVQGVDWAPDSGDLWAVDHGPTGMEAEAFRTGRDELNRVRPGGDHGWPSVSGRVDHPASVTPVVEWTPAIAPSGLAFVTAPESAWLGDAFVTGLRGRQLRRVVVDHSAGRAVCEEVLLEDRFGRLRGVQEAPDGSLLLATSNRDRRGDPFPGDDRLLRVRPTPASAPGS
jgi:glucose/arabinose dehydrogenase